MAGLRSRDSVAMTAPLRVVVAGGGFAAAELLLALRSLAEERVELELIAPDPSLTYKPHAPGGLAQPDAVPRYDLAALPADAGAGLRRDAIAAVAPSAHRARLASGAVASYDALVLAVGARPRATVPGAVTFRDHRDLPQLRRALEAAERVVFTAPAGVTWNLP